MKIIVDAYNLLHAVFPGPRAKDRQKQKLLDELREYAYASGNSILLVYDGGDFTYPYMDEQKHVSLIWAGQRMSADDWIMEYLDKHKNQSHNLLVASSDREIQAHASDLGVVCMGAYSFYKTILSKISNAHVSAGNRASKMNDIIHKTSKQSDENIDALMYEASEDAPTKVEYVKKSPVKNNGKKVSKTERVLLRQLKKL